MMNIRPPVVAGMFYTAGPDQLAREVDHLLAQVKPIVLDGSLIALIVPHAGYPYSGATAAHAYALLRGSSYETVLLISPSHREYFTGVSVFNGSAYRTPLGEIAIDETIRDELVRDETIIRSSAHGHGAEHAIEVQLPFLQRVMSGFRIVPIVMGDQRREFCFHLGEKIGAVMAEKSVLLVASSDLSHYHPHDEAVALDRIVIDDISAFNGEKLMDDLDAERCEACGGGPIVAVMTAAKQLGADSAKVLHHCDSGSATGEHSAVVGYLSAAITRTR